MCALLPPHAMTYSTRLCQTIFLSTFLADDIGLLRLSPSSLFAAEPPCCSGRLSVVSTSMDADGWAREYDQYTVALTRPLTRNTRTDTCSFEPRVRGLPSRFEVFALAQRLSTSYTVRIGTRTWRPLFPEELLHAPPWRAAAAPSPHLTRAAAPGGPTPLALLSRTDGLT